MSVPTARAKTWVMTYHGGHIPRYGLDPFPFDLALVPIRAFAPVFSRYRGTSPGEGRNAGNRIQSGSIDVKILSRRK